MPLQPSQAAPVGQHPCTNTLVLGFKTLPFPAAWLLGSSWGSLDTVQEIIKFSHLPELSSNCYQWFFLSPFILALLALPLKHSKNKGTDWDCLWQEGSKSMHIKPCWTEVVKHISTSSLPGSVQGCDQTFIPRPGPPHLRCRSAAFPGCIHGSFLPLCCLSYLLPHSPERGWVASVCNEAKELNVFLRITTKLVLPEKTQTEIGSGEQLSRGRKGQRKNTGWNYEVIPEKGKYSRFISNSSTSKIWKRQFLLSHIQTSQESNTQHHWIHIHASSNLPGNLSVFLYPQCLMFKSHYRCYLQKLHNGKFCKTRTAGTDSHCIRSSWDQALTVFH